MNPNRLKMIALACFALLPLVASAQVVGTPTVSAVPAPKMDQPIGQLTLPVESASLSSHVGLQFGYSRIDLGAVARTSSIGEGVPTGESAGINVVSLGLEAQHVLFGRFEVGLNVPFLLHGWVGGLGQVSGADTAFGNLQLNLKAKLLGSSADSYAVSVYANTTLPTTSADLPERGFVVLHSGVAATGKLNIATVGAATGVYALINGTDRLYGGESAVIYTIDMFGSVRLHEMVALQVAMQMGIPVHPGGGEVALALTPALQVYPTEQLHLDVGSRIGLTDAGKGYAGGGRASLLVSAGYNF